MQGSALDASLGIPIDLLRAVLAVRRSHQVGEPVDSAEFQEARHGVSCPDEFPYVVFWVNPPGGIGYDDLANVSVRTVEVGGAYMCGTCDRRLKQITA
jgi:hypothetical protein